MAIIFDGRFDAALPQNRNSDLLVEVPLDFATAVFDRPTHSWNVLDLSA